MSIFWVEHDAPLSSSSFLSLSFHLTPSRLFCPLTLLSLSPSLFEGKQLCRSGAKEQATMSLPPPPPRARACVWEGENLERVHCGRNQEMLLPLLCVCLRDLRGRLFLTLLIVKQAQVWGSSSFHFISLFFPTLNLFGCR